MHKYWHKKSEEEIKSRVFGALKQNINSRENNILGVPASHLDDKVFSQDATFLKDAPFISTLVHNPNHIGCHTLGKSEHFFAGTQALEREVIELCAVDILRGEPGEQDGYVASGGTEANIQAIWVYRNYFQAEHGAHPGEIAIICSADNHYSMNKAANLLSLDIFQVPVDEWTRELSAAAIRETLEQARAQGKRFFIVVANMMTTMFGSVDCIEPYVAELQRLEAPFKIHVDGAYGGFYFPFAESENTLNFANSHISSFTLDAHKMAQAPYGTGVFLIRKGLIKYSNTKQASYVEGEDYTLIGSRSGANAVAIWMILMKNGPFGWDEKIFVLQKRTQWVCDRLVELGVQFYRHPKSNIVTIRSEFISPDVADEFGLVPDNHAIPHWYKIVVMDHVTVEKLMPLVERIRAKKD